MTGELFDLTSKVAVITGGNGGIGLGIARGMAQNGAHVVIAARDRKKSHRAAGELRKLGVEALSLELDIRSEESIVRMIGEARKAFGHINILVNNAGINRNALADEFTVEDWREILDTNLIGAYVACREVYPLMQSAGGGKIINIGSVTALFASKRSIPYSASKSALAQLTRSLALAWGKDNIQANAILPGWVETEMTEGLRRSPDAAIRQIRDSITDRIPAGRWAVADDIAGAAVFLASRAADYITGAVLTVDGGYSVA